MTMSEIRADLTNIEAKAVASGYSFEDAGVDIDNYEFSILNDISLAGGVAFGAEPTSTYGGTSPSKFAEQFINEDQIEVQETIAVRVGGGSLEELSQRGINYVYLAAAEVDKFDGIAIEGEAALMKVYGMYSYSISAPTVEKKGTRIYLTSTTTSFEVEESETTGSGLGMPSSGMGMSEMAYMAEYTCIYDGQEAATYDAKFGALNHSASISTVVGDYVNSIAQDLEVSQLSSWYNNKARRIMPLSTPGSNIMINSGFYGGFTGQITGSSDISTPARGGSTSLGAMGGTSGGGGGGY